MIMKIAIDINDIIRDNIEKFKECYVRYIDPSFEINNEDINSFDMMDVFPFDNENDFKTFKYIDYPFELFGRAELVNPNIPAKLSDWTNNILKGLDDEYIPESIILFSPFEIALTIQSTLRFLSDNSIRLREYYFPVDSMTIFDRADIVITANPNLIENAPEDKIVIKINTPYNKDIECKYAFDSIIDLITDEKETVIKILEGELKDE